MQIHFMLSKITATIFNKIANHPEPRMDKTPAKKAYDCVGTALGNKSRAFANWK